MRLLKHRVNPPQLTNFFTWPPYSSFVLDNLPPPLRQKKNPSLKILPFQYSLLVSSN